MDTFFEFSGEKLGKRAIAYYRHSAEDKQENSVPIQREHAQKFAQQNGIQIIHEEADEGKTGLLANRPGFITLFTDWIENPNAPPFEYILVYDVSRWGRFQNQNEPAHYEFRCTMRNKRVIYIEDGFPKEGQQLIGSLQTAVKRYMAAEYSRQLSGKVFHGCMKVSEQGYSAGGTPCYGMARELLDEHKQPIRFLKKGEHKEISNQRVRFVPLNDETTQVVRDIFRMFTKEGMNLSSIVVVLNERGIASASGGVWNKDKIVRILLNETYTGVRMYNKTWNRLRQGKRENPRCEWVAYKDAFAPIITQELFDQTQKKLWYTLGKWKQGKQAIKEARMLILKGIRDFFQKKGLTDDDIFPISHHFPLIISSSINTVSLRKEWCFLLSNEQRHHQYVLGVGVVQERSHPIDQFFIIPTKDFGMSGLCFFTEHDAAYTRYLIPIEQLEKAILLLAGKEGGNQK